MKSAIKALSCLILAVLLLELFSPSWAKAAQGKFNMSYIYFGSPSDYVSLVDKSQNSLDEVSPNYFELTAGGGLVLTPAVDPDFIDEMHARGISVVPFLSNHWSRALGRAALENRAVLAAQLAGAVAQFNLDGVNIDLENLTPSERGEYVDFVRLLRRALPPGKTVAVSVAANPWGTSAGWQGSYDYAGLAEHCDYLMVMAYDEHYYGGPPGPVSSLTFMEDSLKYAVSVAPREKIVLGLPFYGRIWAEGGGHPDGYGVSNSKIKQLVKSYSGLVYTDPKSLSSRAVITVGPGEARPVIGGQALDCGRYVIWYESEQSLKAKLQLVAKYGIKGTGSWCLGQEDSGTWNYYKLRLNNCLFEDIGGCWARDYILNAYMNNWVTGVAPDRFSPDEPLTRAQAAAMLVRRLGFAPESNPAYSFDDCLGTWAQPYLETARKYNIIAGIGNNLFAPDRPITRREIAIMIGNAAPYLNCSADKTAQGAPVLSLLSAPGGTPAAAVGLVAVQTEMAAAAIAPGAAAPAGVAIMPGSPADTVTRAEMAVLLSRI